MKILLCFVACFQYVKQNSQAGQDNLLTICFFKTTLENYILMFCAKIQLPPRKKKAL